MDLLPVQHDIEIYVDSMLCEKEKFRRMSAGFKNDLKTTFLEKSSGVSGTKLIFSNGSRFRWVQCQLDYIQSLRRESARREALKSLPPGLPETYQQILDRTGQASPDDFITAQNVLKWLVFGEGRLTLEDLHVAIAIDPEDECMDESIHGYEPIVQLLLGKGAEVNAQGGDYGNALQAASAGDHESIVHLLLDKGAEVNTQGGHYGNALRAASIRGHEAVVRLLLERGATSTAVIERVMWYISYNLSINQPMILNIIFIAQMALSEHSVELLADS
jgi:hypothetical protein